MKPTIHLRFKMDGQEIILSDASVEPLSLDDLISFESYSSFKLSVRGGTVCDPVAITPRKVNMQATMDATYTNQCFALVESGWLPPVFALPNALILADRNIVTDISKRFNQGKLVERKEQRTDYFDLTASYDYQAKINLAPFALEGNLRRRPTRQEVISQLREAYRKVSQALPSIAIVPVNDHLVDGVMGILEDSHSFFHKRLEFLKSSIHLLGNTAGKMRRRKVWSEIISHADAANLPRTDFCVIAAISAVTASNICNPARGILKPKPNYDYESAYNALCDIQLLSLLIHALHDFPQEKTVLLTKDISLAKFWVGIAPLSTSKKTPLVNCSFQIHNKLLPLDQYWVSELYAIMDG
ncbi:hypothetical protein [Pseudomonas lopnurensis]|uniref:hypothetical protein n=1 Tax=Pseudomonas lopnurensis TaxID=1477517 RepID=UPI0028A736D0|nr:hypothetical protein [Pseudomonas lopnurensis]